jgi:SAM-dependent methyltransferase
VTTTWEQDAATFFDSRADSVTGRPSLAELCYVSGRDPRVWEDGALYESMIASICAQAGLDRSSTVLEVGCAGGFLALGLAPRVAQYVGVDVSAPAIELARRLDLPNAEFRHVNGKRLPFEDDGFDAAISYDVVTNFPDFDAVARLVRESVRVVRPGGRVLIGSVPDRATEDSTSSGSPLSDVTSRPATGLSKSRSRTQAASPRSISTATTSSRSAASSA